MAEPITSTALVGAAGMSVGAAVAAGVGVDPQALFFSLWGATFGLTFAERVPLWRAIAVFCSVVVASAGFAQWAAAAWFQGELHARNGLACALAIVFHPLVNSVVTLVRPVLLALLRRFGIEP